MVIRHQTWIDLHNRAKKAEDRIAELERLCDRGTERVAELAAEMRRAEVALRSQNIDPSLAARDILDRALMRHARPSDSVSESQSHETNTSKASHSENMSTKQGSEKIIQSHRLADERDRAYDGILSGAPPCGACGAFEHRMPYFGPWLRPEGRWACLDGEACIARQKAGGKGPRSSNSGDKGWPPKPGCNGWEGAFVRCEMGTRGCDQHAQRTSEVPCKHDRVQTNAAGECRCAFCKAFLEPRTNDAPRVTGTRDEWVAAAQREQVDRINAQDEVNRLRTVILTGGAMYRAERAALGIPGGHEADLDKASSKREEAFRMVLECIAATAEDYDTRTLASAILNENGHRTQEQHEALESLAEELGVKVTELMKRAARTDYPTTTCKRCGLPRMVPRADGCIGGEHVEHVYEVKP